MLKAGVNCLVCKSLEKLPNNRVFLVELLECPGLLWLGHVKADFDLCRHVRNSIPMIATVEMVNPHQIAVHCQQVGYAGPLGFSAPFPGFSAPVLSRLAA